MLAQIAVVRGSKQLPHTNEEDEVDAREGKRLRRWRQTVVAIALVWAATAAFGGVGRLLLDGARARRAGLGGLEGRISPELFALVLLVVAALWERRCERWGGCVCKRRIRNRCES